MLPQVPFLTETPSQESVWTISVVRVLVLSKAAYDGLLDSYPLQIRHLLSNLRKNGNKVRPRKRVQRLAVDCSGCMGKKGRGSKPNRHMACLHL